MTLTLVEQQTSPASWYVVKGSNDTYWRVEVPAKAIGAQVFKIPIETGKEEFSQPGIRNRTFRWVETEDGAAYPDHQGAAVFTRPDEARAAHALAMKAEGHRIVAEVDDNYFAPTRQNISMRLRYDNKSRDAFRNAINVFDALVTTTVKLRDQYRELLEVPVIRGNGKKSKRLRRRDLEYHVCGNHVDPAHWPDPAPNPEGRLRIGWMGSDSHFRDIKLAYPALKWAADQGHQVVLIGYDPRWHPQCAVQGVSGLRYGDEFGFPYTWVPWVDPREFERSRVAWPIDIGLAPLERNTFNLGKSDVKWLEYTMSGAATIASAGTVFGEIAHGDTGFLANSPEAFHRYTRELCENPRLREDITQGAVEYVRSRRLIEHHEHEWREAIVG